MLFENFSTALTSSISIQNIIEEAHHSVIYNDTNRSKNLTAKKRKKWKHGTQIISIHYLYIAMCYGGVFYMLVFFFIVASSIWDEQTCYRKICQESSDCKFGLWKVTRTFM